MIVDGKNIGGRPKGRKNNKTLLKEAHEGAVLASMQLIGAKEAKKIAQAMADKAIEGDVQAAKLFFDRWWPASKQVEAGKQAPQVTILIGETHGNPQSKEYVGEEARIGQTIDATAVQSDGEITPAEARSARITLSTGSERHLEGSQGQ